MLEPIKPASGEQVRALYEAGTADLDTNCQVMSLGENLAVIRTAVEIDPVIMAPKASTREKALFIWGLENHLRLTGVKAYYFNIHTEDQEWIDVVKAWGAVQQSTGPELRFKKSL